MGRVYPFAVVVQIFGAVNIIVVIFIVICVRKLLRDDLRTFVDPAIERIHRGKNGVRVPFTGVFTRQCEHRRTNRPERKSRFGRINAGFAFAGNRNANLVRAGVDPV